ncbi:MAG: phospholipid/cholesterol/gamma-HCH transport system substrate-binding protein [Myxococcota bacterium]|jgi:phospholipid/cholesterol/gamma-HCH transport system substrate-binding protein
MEDSRRLSLIVGTFFMISLAALGVAVLSLSSESGLFTSYYRIYGNFNNVQGLLAGAPVWMAGKEVGRVDEVVFTEFGSDKPILVTMRINRSIQTRVRSDSVASIGTIGVLGDSYIEIAPGSPDGAVLIDGETIPANSPTNLYAVLTQGTEALGNVSALARNLNRVVSDVREGGVITKAASAVDAASNIILEVESGSGLLHSLLYDDYAGGGVQSIEGSLASLENILKEVETGEGVLHSLIYPGNNGGSASDIEASLSSLASILEEVKTGEGLLHSLIYNPDTGEMTADAAAALADLSEVLKQIENGEGTLGLLISDPTLYEEMSMLLGGANRSVVLRTLVRMATDK